MENQLKQGDVLIAKDPCLSYWSADAKTQKPALIVGKEYVVNESKPQYGTIRITSEIAPMHGFYTDPNYEGYWGNYFAKKP